MLSEVDKCLFFKIALWVIFLLIFFLERCAHQIIETFITKDSDWLIAPRTEMTQCRWQPSMILGLSVHLRSVQFEFTRWAWDMMLFLKRVIHLEDFTNPKQQLCLGGQISPCMETTHTYSGWWQSDVWGNGTHWAGLVKAFLCTAVGCPPGYTQVFSSSYRFVRRSGAHGELLSFGCADDEELQGTKTQGPFGAFSSTRATQVVGCSISLVEWRIVNWQIDLLFRRYETCCHTLESSANIHTSGDTLWAGNTFSCTQHPFIDSNYCAFHTVQVHLASSVPSGSWFCSSEANKWNQCPWDEHQIYW